MQSFVGKDTVQQKQEFLCEIIGEMIAIQYPKFEQLKNKLENSIQLDSSHTPIKKYFQMFQTHAHMCMHIIHMQVNTYFSIIASSDFENKNPLNYA